MNIKALSYNGKTFSVFIPAATRVKIRRMARRATICVGVAAAAWLLCMIISALVAAGTARQALLCAVGVGGVIFITLKNTARGGADA